VRAYYVAAALFGVTGLAAILGPLWDSRQRAPEATVRAYLAAVEQGDLDAALDRLAPVARAAERERVSRQLGNRYRVESLVLGAPSVADRLLDRSRPPAWTVVGAAITPVAAERWRSSSTADLVHIDGRWYLASPLFA